MGFWFVQFSPAWRSATILYYTTPTKTKVQPVTAAHLNVLLHTQNVTHRLRKTAWSEVWNLIFCPLQDVAHRRMFEVCHMQSVNKLLRHRCGHISRTSLIMHLLNNKKSTVSMALDLLEEVKKEEKEED